MCIHTTHVHNGNSVTAMKSTEKGLHADDTNQKYNRRTTPTMRKRTRGTSNYANVLSAVRWFRMAILAWHRVVRMCLGHTFSPLYGDIHQTVLYALTLHSIYDNQISLCAWIYCERICTHNLLVRRSDQVLLDAFAFEILRLLFESVFGLHTIFELPEKSVDLRHRCRITTFFWFNQISLLIAFIEHNIQPIELSRVYESTCPTMSWVLQSAEQSTQSRNSNNCKPQTCRRRCRLQNGPIYSISMAERDM